LSACGFISIRDLQEIIKPKNVAAGYACRHIFGLYMDHFFLGVPLLKLHIGLNMRKSASFAVGLVLLTVSACTPNTPNSETPSSTKPIATSTTPSTETPSTETPSSTKPIASNPNSWYEYSSEAGKFSVSMPNKPEEKSEDKKTDIATVKMNVAISEFNDSAYFASYADFPEKFPDAEIEPRLNEAMKGIVGGLQGKVTSSKESKLGTASCRDFEATGKIQAIDALFKGRICLNENRRFYQMFVLSPATKFSNTDVDRFLGSFKIKG
jgi:hypothetical protein